MSSLSVKLYTSSQAVSSTATSTSMQSTDSDGCVVCLGNVNCPTCAEDEYCVLTALTCDSCPSTYCAKNSGTTLSNSTSTSTSSLSSGYHKTVSIVVGSVVAGVAVIFVLVLMLLYKKVWKPRRDAERRDVSDQRLKNLLANNFDLDMEADFEEEDEEDIDDLLFSDEESDGNILMGDEVHEMHDSVSTYQGKESSYGMPGGPPGILQPGNRSSSSTIFTRASNILPIAYIPGVTSTDPNKHLNSANLFKNHPLNTVGDVRSHITLGSSIFDGIERDDDDDEERGNKGKTAGNAYSTSTVRKHNKEKDNREQLTTAIRAQPRLVHINEEEECPEEGEKEDSANSITIEPCGSEAQDQEDSEEEGSFIFDVEIPNSLRIVSDNSQPGTNNTS